MCGIFAAIDFERPFDQSDLKCFYRSTEMVDYRGPDAKGYLTFNTFQKKINSENFNIFLGHNRLSIIDLSKEGNQPFKDGDTYIIYNGEIFNYLELKADLIAEGVEFKTRSDTEVILKIYKRYGENGFNLLNGMWVFLILDLRKNKIIVSRDRFSIKPLFYYRTGTSIYFASEIKQILPLVKKRTINKSILFNFLQQGLLDFNEDTFFDGIKRIGSKSNYIFDLQSKELTVLKYWDFESNGLDSENYSDEFRELFIDSIKIRLRSDVKVGALLSGGLDSSAISLIAHELTNGQIQTFSVVSRDKQASEEKFIDILVGKSGIKNTKLFIEHNEILKNLEIVLSHQDEPFSTLSIVAQYTILELIRKESGITVVLDGQGGDEILMGYLKYYFFNLRDLFNKRNFGGLSREILFSLINGTVLYNSDFSLSKRYIPFLVREKNKYLKLTGRLEKTWGSEELIDKQKSDIDKYSIPVLTRYEDRNSMANSIETRLPYLDHRLVNFALNLKNKMKIKNGWTKYILRKSIDELPDKIKWRRDKKGFIIPEAAWYKNELRGQIYALFGDSILDKMGIIDQKMFIEYYNAFLNGSRNIHYSDISRVFITEKWARNYF